MAFTEEEISPPDFAEHYSRTRRVKPQKRHGDGGSNTSRGNNGGGRQNEGRENISAERFRLVRFDQVQVSAASQYLVKGLIPRKGLTVIWGPPKCGKSFFVYDLLMHVALNWEYRSRRVRSGPVVYLALEGGAGMGARKAAFLHEHAHANIDEASVPFYLMTGSIDLIKDHGALIAAIANQLGDVVPIALSIDTLNRSLVGSESEDRDMGNYLRAADAIAQAFGCAVIIVHHCGHDGTRPRGHSSLIGACDAQISVKREGNTIISTLELMKDGPTGDRLASSLQVMEVGFDEDGDLLTSCVVRPVQDAEAASPAATKKGPKWTRQARIALKALHATISDLGLPATASGNIPAGVRTAALEQWRERAIQIGISTSEKPSARRMAFQRATEWLIANEQVGMCDDQVWVPHA